MSLPTLLDADHLGTSSTRNCALKNHLMSTPAPPRQTREQRAHASDSVRRLSTADIGSMAGARPQPSPKLSAPAIAMPPNRAIGR